MHAFHSRYEMHCMDLSVESIYCRSTIETDKSTRHRDMPRMETAVDTPTSRPAGHIGVHSIDHFALNVPCVADAARFFESFGLRVEPVGDTLDLFAADGYRWARVLPAERKSLAYLSFNCFEGDLPAVARQVLAAGATLREGAAPAEQRGIWFDDPDGNLINVKVGPKTTPTDKAVTSVHAVGPNLRGACARSEVRIVRPRRLSHVLMFSPDVLRAVDFYRNGLGLNLSDRSRDIIAFMHGAHGSDHHLVAFAKSRTKGWHHSAWDVADVDEVGEGAAQMEKAGYTEGWGTGRHVLGSNYFHYVKDPWGSFAEYSADIDFVAAGVEWVSGDFPPEDALYLWGPHVPEDFTVNTES